LAGIFLDFVLKFPVPVETKCSSIRRTRSMDWPDYLRDQAAMYRQLAEQEDDAVANNIEDNLTGG
jgi:hypothetical protein